MLPRRPASPAATAAPAAPTARTALPGLQVNARLALHVAACAALLFVSGSVVAGLTTALLSQQHITRFHPDPTHYHHNQQPQQQQQQQQYSDPWATNSNTSLAILGSWLSSSGAAPWLTAVAGVSSVLLGLLYPIVDTLLLGRPHVTAENSWANLVRCAVLFLGITYATSKMPFDGDLSIFLAATAVALWYIFDRTLHGFGLGLFVALLGTIFASLLTLNGAVIFTRADLFGVRSWMPVVLFASCASFFKFIC